MSPGRTSCCQHAESYQRPAANQHYQPSKLFTLLQAMQRAALPVLLRLLVQPATRPHVPAVLARLIEGSEALQKAAADADTVRLLAGLLAAEGTSASVSATAPPPMMTSSSGTAPVDGIARMYISTSSRLREGCLRALGSLCLNRDDSRKQLMEAKVLRHIVRALEDPHGGVRAAAALCVRALSRCVRTLRGGLLEGVGSGAVAGARTGGGGELAPLLVGLLADENEDVQVQCMLSLHVQPGLALARGCYPAPMESLHKHSPQRGRRA